MLVEVGSGNAGLQLFEPVGQLEGFGIEQRELLLHRNREVPSFFESLAGRAHLLVRAQALRVAHLTSLNEVIGAAG